MILPVLFSLAIAAAPTGPAAGEDWPAICTDDSASEACRTARFEQVRIFRHLSTIDQDAASGAHVYRVQGLDAWYRALPTVSFERRPGQPPNVVVIGESDERLSAPISSETWKLLVSSSALADRELAPLPPSEDGSIVVCADGVTLLFEATHAPIPWDDEQRVRRKVDHTCGGSPATAFAEVAWTLATESLPACAEVRNLPAIIKLRACLPFRGDTLAAADLFNVVEEGPYDDVTPQTWDRWLQPSNDTRLNWSGQVVTQSTWLLVNPSAHGVAAFVADRVAKLTNLNFHPGLIGADNPSRGWVTGQITYRTSKDDDARTMVADYRQVWGKKNGDWALESWTVEPFELLPD